MWSEESNYGYPTLERPQAVQFRTLNVSLAPSDAEGLVKSRRAPGLQSTLELLRSGF